MIEALVHYQIDPEAFTFEPDHPDEGLPKQFGNVAFDRSVPGTMFYAMPMQRAVPSSLFYLRTGFEIGMAYSTTDNAHAIWQELIRVVREHDHHMIDYLLITVGGPDRDGFTFPAESYLTEAALQMPEPLKDLRHLSRVSLHFWTTDLVVELHPRLAATPIIYPGQYSTAYFSAAVTPAQPQGSSFHYLQMNPPDQPEDASS